MTGQRVAGAALGPVAVHGDGARRDGQRRCRRRPPRPAPPTASSTSTVGPGGDAPQQVGADQVGRRSGCGAGRSPRPTVPAWVTRPASRTSTSSASIERVERVVGDERRSRRRTRRGGGGGPAGWRRGWSTSSAARGSSSSSRSGSVTSARARATRWAWPPESSRGRAPACAARPTRSSHVDAAAAGAGPRGARGAGAEGHVVERRSGAGTGGGPGGRTPTRRRSGGTKVPGGGSSSTRAAEPHVAAVDGLSPARQRRIVLLPAPFGPRTASTDPAAARQLHVQVERARGAVGGPRRGVIARTSHRRGGSTRTSERDDQQHEAQRDRRVAGRTRARR